MTPASIPRVRFPAILLAALLAAPLLGPVSILSATNALAQDGDLSAKEAFQAAKELGTAEGWDAFLSRFPQGFLADLARAYKARLEGGRADGRTLPIPGAATATTEPQTAPPAPPRPAADSLPAGDFSIGLAAASLDQPALTRGTPYMRFPEQFNRYYTDRSWQPSRVVYVSPQGGGNGATRETPTTVEAGLQSVAPGTLVFFLKGAYAGCFELGKERSGTYDQPVVLYGERTADDAIGVSMQCCSAGRKSCFNMEHADHVAVDGFEMIGGDYGVRIVGAGYDASQHSKGIAVLNCKGRDQFRDPFFTAQSDWLVLERNIAFGAKKGDGHGIYISNGGDWNIVRANETYANVSSDFQINADPKSTCLDEGIPYADPRCDAFAGEGEGGRGASDYFLVEANFFHHGLGPGANFTSVRRSLIRNNIFGPQARHNVSFWQQTDNPKLGSSENKILHNLFLTTSRHGVKFENNSVGNEFANNVVVGFQVRSGAASANPQALLMEVDATAAANTFTANAYIGGGRLEGREPGADELVEPRFSTSWFTDFPLASASHARGLAPTPEAPFLDKGRLLPDAPRDREGHPRAAVTDLGPFELP